MKNIRLRIAFVLLVVAAAIFGFWPKRQIPIERRDSNSTATVDAKNKLVTESSTNSNAAILFASERIKKLRSILESENVPIVFWGKVVDETGGGISNATIKYHVRGSGVLNAVGLIEEDIHNGVATSAVDGSFEIKQRKGMSLAIEGITKSGYRLYENQKLGISYTVTSALHKANQQSPQVYVMRSSESSPDIQTWQRKVKLPWNGSDIQIDLETGQISPYGNVTVTSNRTGSVGRFDWSLTVTLQNGELAEAKANTAFIAPENGYAKKWQCGYSANDKDFVSGTDANVYYRLNGKYGRLKLLIYSDSGSNDVSLYLESFANNSGGRNTEGRQ